VTKIKERFRLHRIFDFLIPLALVISIISGGYFFISFRNEKLRVESEKTKVQDELGKTVEQLEIIQRDLNDIKGQDQVKINKDLSEEVRNIQDTYKNSVSAYENLLDLKSQTNKTQDEDKLFSEILSLLSKKDYKKASEKITELTKKISDEKIKLASVTIPQNVPVNNAPPGSGYSRQQIQTDSGNFLVSLIAADIGSTKVIVDTASDSDCSNNCPVLPLATYISRNGAYAGVNGSYFCPSTYPTCAGKTNSFDLLLMNKNKTYFNSANNVYSTNPGVIFGGSYVRFVTAVSQWGRDTGIDGMISNFPLLVSNGNITFTGDSDSKQSSKGNRGFVANKGNNIYIGVVFNAAVAESAKVMKAMGIENALNLDDGGSTALWSGGYKVGPGRDLPNVILFVKK